MMLYILVSVISSHPDRIFYSAEDCHFIEEKVIEVFSSRKEAEERIREMVDLPPLGDHMGGRLFEQSYLIKESEGAILAV